MERANDRIFAADEVEGTRLRRIKRIEAGYRLNPDIGNRRLPRRLNSIIIAAALHIHLSAALAGRLSGILKHVGCIDNLCDNADFGYLATA